MAGKKKKSTSPGLLLKNKKAFHLYTIVERFEAGIALQGSEVKALREHNANFGDAFVRIINCEAFLESLHIGDYKPANRYNHAPQRTRRLLLKRREIERLIGKCREKGLTLVPLAIYLKGPWVKLEIGLARGKKLHDKRQDLADRDATREIARAMKERGRSAE